MKHGTAPTDDQEPSAPGLRGQLDTLKTSPGLYLGTALAAGSALAPDPALMVGIPATAAAAAGWAALGLRPGPWRWLPGHGEPWEWMCRRGRRGYQRAVRRMRRRLDPAATAPLVAPDGAMVEGPGGLLIPLPVLTIGDGWYQHPDRAALVRAAITTSRRARCTALRTAWTRGLPNWDSGWWRPYSPMEMALRAGPVAALPMAGAAGLSWWAWLLTSSAAAGWGAWVWDRPDPATPPVRGEPAASEVDADWYSDRWKGWVADAPGGSGLPGSYLTNIRLDDDRLSAVIVSTTTRPALDVRPDAISIAFRLPVRSINVYRPQSMDSSRAMLTVRLRPLADTDVDQDDLAAVWREDNPYPGSQLVDVRETELGRTFDVLLPRTGAGQTAVDTRVIAQALDLDGEEPANRLHLLAKGSRKVQVTEMTRNPLQEGVALDLDALVLDEQGYVTVGRDIYGRPAKWRLAIPNPGKLGMNGGQGMSAVHSFSSGTTGAGKSSLEETLLIAQRLNGMVGWLADGKLGAGFATWTRDVDWLIKSHYGAMCMAEAAAAVGRHRFSAQLKMQWRDEDGYVMDGRSFFVPDEPFSAMQVTFDEFNAMTLQTTAGHVKPLLEAVSTLGRQTRSAGIGARIYVQIPNLDSIGTDKNAGAIRDMLQSGNIALFRTARADIDSMSLGSRSPAFRLQPIPERFPNGAGTAGLGYIADGSDQFIQSRMMYHPNPVRIAQNLPLPTLTDTEAEAAGPAYLHREEYRHLDAESEEAFLRELLEREAVRPNPGRVYDLAPGRTAPLAPVDEDDDLDALVPPSRSQLVWDAVDGGARRNKDIAQVVQLQPANVAGATKRLQRLGKLEQLDRDWYTREPIDA
ncbi:hypothetical protein [Streptomyces sp. SM12]|uniref:hypothetical protein n=1 Tax=Streptomyces sp. SM12 TaxID=1071602 RepID=UPI000CD50DC6|nr:hypothetical protein [Streptomyces sp. SM12]